MKRKISIFLAFLLTVLSISGCGSPEFGEEDGIELLNEIVSVIDEAAEEEDESGAKIVSGEADRGSPDRAEEIKSENKSSTADDKKDAKENSEKSAKSKDPADSDTKNDETDISSILDRDGEYSSKEDVALYLHLYGELPSNFITKKEATALGWEGGSLEPYAPGKSIGGDYFGNYEGLLPKKKGREYHECDIDTKGAKKRGAKRIIYSNDGLIYYTEDHYETFELLYGEMLGSKAPVED